VALTDYGPSTVAQGVTYVRLASLLTPTFGRRLEVLLTALSESAVEEDFNPRVAGELILKNLIKPWLIS
jgi:hypothetical protein